MAGNFETILINDDGGVRTITLDRPDVLNSFNTQMLNELGKAVRHGVKDKSVRCLVITGAGRGFCAGQDLADVKDRYQSDEPIELGRHLRDYYNPLIASLQSMEKPVIASINGAAAGAGCSLALACDLRIACESASFLQAFIHVGLVPDSGSTFFLPRLIGTARAFEMACTGRKVKAEEALRMGLVNQVVPDDQLVDATNKLAAKLVSLPPRGIALTKRALNASPARDLIAQLDYEAQLQTTAGKTQDHREGVTAFLEKRKPAFTGR